MKEQDERAQDRAADQGGETAALRIDDLIVSGEDLANLDRLDEDFESVLEDREPLPQVLVDEDPLPEENEAEQAADFELEENDIVDRDIEPVGRIGNVQSVIEAPRPDEGDKPPSGQLSHKVKTTMEYDSGRNTYSQKVSDAARAEGLGWMSVGNVPVARDYGRGAIGAFEAAVKRHEGRTDAEKEKGLVICEVDTDHGHRSQVVLEHAKAKSPDLYNHPNFRVVVTARTQERLDQLQGSGAFDAHAGKVGFELYDPQKPRLPAGTTLAFAPEVNYMPTTRLYRTPTEVINQSTGDVLAEAGGIAVATERTVIKGESPVVIPDADNGDLPQVQYPHAFDKFYTSRSDESRAEYEAALRGRVLVEFKPDGLENTEEGWRNRDIEAFMAGSTPGNNIKSWQPEVTDTISALSRQSELVYVDGFFRKGNEKLPWPQMSRREGQLWRHTTHEELVVLGADRAGAKAYVPAKDNGKFNHILIDHSPDAEARAAVREVFDDIVTTDGPEDSVRLVAGAKDRLEKEQERQQVEQADGIVAGATETVSAVDAIERGYQRYLEKRPDAAVDHDLALGLARQLYKFSHYEEAIKFADRAIKAAPQMAANAHNLRAQALIMGERYDEANQAVDAALAISPHDPKLYRTQAAIALRQGDHGAHAAARINELRYTSSRVEDMAHQMDVGWAAVSRALLRESEAAELDGTTEPVATLYTRRDPSTGDITVGTAMNRNQVARSALLRSRAIDMAIASADAVEKSYPEEDTQGRREADERFDKLIDRAVWRRDPDDPNSEVIYPHELVPSELQIVGEVALQAAMQAPGTELEKADRLPVARTGIRERGIYAAEDIAIGYRIDEAGERHGRYTIPLDVYNKPVIIEGATGSGKTTTVSNNALRLSTAGIPWLIIDAGPSPSYGALPEQAARMGQKVYYWDPTKDDISLPTLNIMNPVRGADPQTHLLSLMPWVQTISNGGEPLPQLVGEAAFNVYANAGFDVYTEHGKPNLHTLDYPTAPDLFEFADKVVYKAVMAGYSKAAGDVKAFAERRVMEIKRMERMLGGARPIDWDWLYENNVVIDLSNMEGPLRQAWAAGFQTMYGEYLKTRYADYGGQNIGLQHVTFVEEAHHLYGVPKSEEAAAQQEAARMWAERTTAYRKLGEGTTIVTQAPHKIISEVMENADLIIAHRTPSVNTRRPVSENMGIAEGSKDYEKLRGLERGQAIVSLTGSEPQLIRVAEPADLEREGHPEKVDTASSRPPANAIRGGRRPSDGSEPYTNDELKVAYRTARSPQNASWIVWGTQVGLAMMTGEKIGSQPQVMQQQWSQMTARERECLLDETVEIFVGERQEVLHEFFSTDEFKVALKNTMLSSLKGQPIAGNRPGTKFLVPQLAGLHEYEQLHQPFGAPKPNPRGRARPIRVPLRGVNMPANSGDGGSVAPPRTVKEQLRLIERSEISTFGNDKQHAHNRKVAWVALLGANGGRSFFEALGHFTRGRIQTDDTAELFDRIRHAEIAMGLIHEGEPRPGPLAQYITLANRFLKKAA